MRQTSEVLSHPEDGELVRYLDHQLPHEERRALLTHLSECADCAARLSKLKHESDTVSAYLGSLHEYVAVDEVARARSLSAARQAARARRSNVPARTRMWARAAAAAGVIVLGAYTVQPVRAWVTDQLDRIFGDAPASPTATIAEESVLARGSRVTFNPVNEVFVLEIEHLQASGAVVLEVRDQQEASAQILSGRDESILVLPGGLRVENEPSSEAIYSVTLPARFRLVQIFAGGRPIAILPMEGRTTPWSVTLPLDGESASPR